MGNKVFKEISKDILPPEWLPGYHFSFMNYLGKFDTWGYDRDRHKNSTPPLKKYNQK